MIDLPYSLIIEATDEPDYFGFYSPELAGFSGIGHSVEDCLYQARWGMQEHVSLYCDSSSFQFRPATQTPQSPFKISNSCL